MNQNDTCSRSHAKIEMDHTSLAELNTSKGIGWGSLSVFLLDLAKAVFLKGFSLQYPNLDLLLFHDFHINRLCFSFFQNLSPNFEEPLRFQFSQVFLR